MAMQPSPGTRLDSWKVIADYLGRNVRTVTRWADEREMPVHRVPGGKRGAVFAYTGEIDAWLLSQNRPGLEGEQAGESSKDKPENEANRGRARESTGDWRTVFPRLLKWRIALPALGVVIAAAGISAVLRPVSSRDPQFISVEFGTDSLDGMGPNGETIWTYKYRKHLAKDFLSEPVRSIDLTRVSDYFGDGKKEVAAIVPIQGSPDLNEQTVTEVDFFSGTGKLLWSYSPEQSFRFGDHDLKGPWTILDIFTSEAESDRGATIWIAAAHHTWGNSFVTRIDPRSGKGSLRFVNTGDLRRLKEVKTASGTYLLAAGFNNEWDSGSLAILREDRAFAASPQTPGTRHECKSCPPGMPDYYFVFPRSELNRIAGAYEDWVDQIRVSDDGIELLKLEGFGRERHATYYLLSHEAPFTVISVRYNSDYDMLHRAWSASGKITHSLQNCPERAHPQPVRLWTPSSGWTAIAVKPALANQ